jgi:hypothetical protein
LQIVRKTNRLPKSPQVFAAGRFRADMCQLAVLGGDIAMEIAAISRPKEGGPRGHVSPPLNS